MGRKGGGRAAFLKGVRHEQDSDDEKAEQARPAKAEAAAAAAPPSPAKQPAQPAANSKASKFLKQEPGEAAADSSDDEPERREGGETRGQVLQRHKREHKALKDQIKRMGKKAKDEAVKLEEEMEKRHAAELAAFDAPKADTAGAVALAASLYSVSLGGEGEEEKKPKKQTKSQKRKEERAKKEAEREARIAAELAELGDTDRVLEERALKKLLRPLGLAIREIPPDGHCLYRSLEDQLRQQSGNGGSGNGSGAAAEGAAEGAAEAGQTFLELRAAAADYMRQHADHFMPFVLEEGAGEDPSEAFEAYCRQVELSADWGGQPELQALAHALKAHILVYSAGMPVLDVGEEFRGSGPTLRLCYLRHAYGLGEHYNSVQPGLAVEDDSEGEDEGEEEEEEGS